MSGVFCGRRPSRLIGLAAVLYVVCCWFAAPAAAETASAPAVLTSVTASKDADGRPRLLLTFDRPIPKYSIVSNDNAQPIIAFAGTVRGPAASFAALADDPFSAAVFDQHDSVLTLTLTASSPIQLVATPAGDNTLYLSFAGIGQPRSQAASAPTGPLPAYADRSPGEDGFELVPLKYADISEVVGLLTSDDTVKPNDTFTPQEPAFGSAGMMNNGAAPSPTIVTPAMTSANDAANQAFGRSINDSIGVDRRLNAIILRGTPERIARLKEKIAKIDVPITSVLLETVFVELTRTGATALGLDFNNTNSQIATATYGTGSNNPAGATSKGLGSIALQAAIYAQVQEGQGRIISKPRISAQSGSSAKIITGDALPILTSITLSGVNGVSQQVQYVTVGVTLQIAPRVSDDGFVTSHVFCEVSSVTGYSQGYPTISQREASTSATVHDGDSFVIGGLTEEDDLSNNIKLPGAADVPFLGKLFQHESSSKSRTELYIVVTPHIVRGGGDGEEARHELKLGALPPLPPPSDR